MRLRRFLNKNWRKIILIIIGIASLIFLVQFLNSYVSKKQLQRLQNQPIKEAISNENMKNTTKQTAIYGETITDQKNTQNSNIINQFIHYCNTKEIQKAYHLLSESCKLVYYPTLEDFERNYYQTVFNTKKTITMQSWINDAGFYTYLVELSDDILATGGNKQNVKKDYYTIIKENGTTMLNINGYIGKRKIEEEIDDDKINIKITNVDVYMDYAIYSFEIKNNQSVDILLDTKEKVNTMYLLDTNNLKYSAFLNENSQQDLLVSANSKKEVKIKFNKVYNPERRIDRICFTDVILDYPSYVSKPNSYKAREKMILSIQL